MTWRSSGADRSQRDRGTRDHGRRASDVLESHLGPPREQGLEHLALMNPIATPGDALR
jgi:hypothetical protein